MSNNLDEVLKNINKLSSAEKVIIYKTVKADIESNKNSVEKKLEYARLTLDYEGMKASEHAMSTCRAALSGEISYQKAKECIINNYTG